MRRGEQGTASAIAGQVGRASAAARAVPHGTGAEVVGVRRIKPPGAAAIQASKGAWRSCEHPARPSHSEWAMPGGLGA